MKPVKPWERVPGGTSSNELLSALGNQATGLESPPVSPEIAEKLTLEKEMSAMNNPTSTQNSTPGVAAASGANTSAGASSLGLGSSLSSPYSSLGGYGGLGGMGGLGSMYGGMGGMGMYGGMGMMGMAGMDQNSSFFQSMQFMQSMGFVINSMCEVVRMLEANTQGLVHLWEAVVNIIKKSKDWIIGLGAASKEKIFKWVFKAMVMLRLAEKDRDEEAAPQVQDPADQEQILECMTLEEKQELKSLKMKKKVYRLLMKVGIVVMGLCLYYFYKKGRLIKHTITAAATESVAAVAGSTDPLAAAFNAAN